MGLRDRRGGDSKRTFCMREKMFAIGDDYWIEDSDGQKTFKVDGKAARLREAEVKKRLIGIRDRYSVDFDEGDDYTAKGNFIDHEYEIERDGEKVAEVSKKWFRVRDTYGVEILGDQDVALVLAVTVCIDAMSHDLGA